MCEEDLAKRDIAEVNLAAAFDLPFACDLDIPALRRQLDAWADLVQRGTANSLRRRAAESRYPEYSDAEFRMLVLVTVLQLRLGVHYNSVFKVGDYDGSDSRNLFIHGCLSGHGGSCATMPVLYTAVGRRLGYPLKLVKAKGHLFCRWDEPGGERFNIEATCEGFRTEPDEYYLTWPEPIPAPGIDNGWYMRSLTAREELAFFLEQRGLCSLHNLQTLRAVEAFCYAHKLVPDFPGYHVEWGIAIIMHRAVEQLVRQAGADPLSRQLVMPAPATEWEEYCYPLAHEFLNKVLRVRGASRQRAAASEAMPATAQQLKGAVDVQSKGRPVPQRGHD
jgi:hypothetical protein